MRSAHELVKEAIRQMAQMPLNTKMAGVLRGLYSIEDALWLECRRAEREAKRNG